MMNKLKQRAAAAALEYIQDGLIGVGSGSTVHFFIQELVKIKPRVDACVASSQETARQLRHHGFVVIELNEVGKLPIYVDGADEVTADYSMIKGGGGALTQEKIIASAADQFICIVDESKWVAQLGVFPIAVEVLPMARSFVARELVKLGGDPEYRQGVVTDNGNMILDVYNLKLTDEVVMEESINLIPGVVENGVFAKRKADLVIVARAQTEP